MDDRIFKNRILMKANLKDLKNEVTWGHTKNLGPIGSAVLTFIGYKQTDRQAKNYT